MNDFSPGFPDSAADQLSTSKQGEPATRLDEQGDAVTPRLAPPEWLEAQAGAGQVTLRWSDVEGAVGYLVYRSDSPEGPFAVINHGGGDILAVPDAPYVDTTGLPDTPYWYAVAAIADPDLPPGPLSAPIMACSHSQPPRPIEVTVQTQTPAGELQRLWQTLGSERLALLLRDTGPGGSHVGEELSEALRLAHAELGTRYVRAHAIFSDDLLVPSQEGKTLLYRFDRIDAIYDRLTHLGLRPVVELSFMPRALALRPQETVFTYRAVVSPPRSWQNWQELIVRFITHLIERYGIAEVSQWRFEVWNEPNLKAFWTGSPEDYFTLYQVTAQAIKSVDSRLLVGGPATAAAAWLGAFLRFVRRQQLPLDFLSTHTYGNLPLNIRRLLDAYGFHKAELWWTEWGVSPTHFAPVNDSVFSAPFLLHGLKRTQGRATMLAYWVVSDHFEELGQAPRLLHGGFGLLTIGNLRKPRYWALALAEGLGTQLVQVKLHGDGAGSLVDAWASRSPDGTIDLLAWNGTLDQTAAAGNPLLDRQLTVRFEQLEADRYHASLARIDATHSNIAAHWPGEKDWPMPEEWAALRACDKLDETPLPAVVPSQGVAELSCPLPMPGVVRIRLVPATNEQAR